MTESGRIFGVGSSTGGIGSANLPSRSNFILPYAYVMACLLLI